VTARRSSALRLGPLVAVMFFTVSGGPFGLEGLVGSVGPGLALLLLVATPLLYSVPETLLIGELASMLPAEGGYYQWVKRAFGRFWGFWNGWLSWTYSLLDMAIYPVLLLQYAHYFAPGLSRLETWLLSVALIWGATWMNLRGTHVVGTASGWFVAAVLAPFGVLAGVALVRWLGQPATLLPVTPFHAAGTSFLGALGLGVSQSIWNYSGWDNASTIGGEIEQASATYPRALARALPLVTGARSAAAQAAYPARPVKVVIPYPPAGGADTVGRILFQKLGEMWGAQFVIDNRGGAGGTIAAAAVAKADRDGYTIMYDATAHSGNPSLYSNLPYDTVKDFQPVFLAALVTNLLVVNRTVEAKTVADVIALAKSTPGGLDWASSGNGTVQHLALEMFKHQAGIKLNHIPYRGGGPVLNDLIGGQGQDRRRR
jgi:hypothetical protein